MTESTAGLFGRRILVVDDDPGLALNLKDILEDLGHAVSTARDGRSAVAQAATEAFHIGIVDMRLPDMSGIDLANQLQHLVPDMEFILMTAYATLESATKAVEQRSIIGYEAKPLDIPRFLSFLEQVAQRQRMQEELAKEQASIRQRLEMVLSPEIDVASQSLRVILDLPDIQALADDIYKTTRVPIAILDLTGNILIAAGWTDICTRFHRVNPDTARHCLESDVYLTRNVTEGEYRAYRCRNGMVDVVTPLVVGGAHIANLFLGQFFYEDQVPDRAVFRAQAEEHAFDVDRYLEALDRVPRFSHEYVSSVMSVYSQLGQLVARLSFSNASLAQLLTQRERAQESLRHWAELFEHSAWGVAIADPETMRYEMMNPAYARMHGYEPEELIGREVDSVYTPDDLAQVVAHRASAEETGHGSFEAVRLRKDGSTFPAYVDLTVVKDDDGRVLFRVGNIQDITERKREQEIAERREADLIYAQRVAHIGSFSYDSTTGVATWSEEVYSIYGRDRNLPAPNVEEHLSYIHPDDRERYVAVVTAAAESGAPHSVEHRIVRRDGQVRLIHHQGDTVRDVNGRILRIVGTVQDITEARRAQELLQQREADLVYAQHMAHIGSFSYDQNADIATWSDELYEIYGRDRSLPAPRRDEQLEYVHPDDREAFLAMAAEFAQSGEAYDIEHRVVRPDGQIRLVRHQGEAIRDDEGSTVRIVGTVQDITDARQAEELLRRREADLVYAQHIAHIGSFSFDQGTDAATWSDELFEIYGRDRDLPAPTRDDQLHYVHPDDRQMLVAATRQAVAAGTPYDVEHRIVRADGEVRLVRDQGEALRDEKGSVIRVVGTVQDITEARRAEEERARLEEQLLQAQKMEAVGRLAGGIAHDFNNLLTIINGYSAMMLRTLGPGEAMRAELEQINQAGERAAGLTRQLLAFSRRQVLAPRVFELNELLSGLGAMLTRLIGEDVRLEFNLAPRLGSIRADPGQVEQVVMNLAVNARDAMPDGGTLNLETSRIDIDADQAEALGGLAPGAYVVLSVTDTGTGMTDDVQEHLFEPFFTTKGVGKGTGLGLATIWGIVNQSGGSIKVESAVGQGTTFHVYLPRVADGTALEEMPPSVAAEGHETILVVEDQPAVRALTVRVLRERGYRVLGVASGPEALDMCGQSGEPIDLLLTDVIMPDMSGRELVSRLKDMKQARQGLKVLYMSGYTDLVEEELGYERMDTQFVQKPFSPANLAQKVRELLDEE